MCRDVKREFTAQYPMSDVEYSNLKKRPLALARCYLRVPPLASRLRPPERGWSFSHLQTNADLSLFA